MKICDIKGNTFLEVEGKVINIKYVVSIVSSYKAQTTMVYVSTSDKAIAIENHSPTDIHDFLRDVEEEFVDLN